MLRLSYILHEHGWATALIGDGDATVQMDVSYLSDGLGDLARAARGILRGIPETTFSFQQEPGEHRITVSHQDDLVRLTVYRFVDTFSGARPAESVMVAECSLSEFATESINCLRRVLDEHGEAGYRERWVNDDFPLREYRDLLELRGELGARPATELTRRCTAPGARSTYSDPKARRRRRDRRKTVRRTLMQAVGRRLPKRSSSFPRKLS